MDIFLFITAFQLSYTKLSCVPKIVPLFLLFLVFGLQLIKQVEASNIVDKFTQICRGRFVLR